MKKINVTLASKWIQFIYCNYFADRRIKLILTYYDDVRICDINGLDKTNNCISCLVETKNSLNTILDLTSVLFGSLLGYVVGKKLFYKFRSDVCDSVCSSTCHSKCT